MKLSTSLISTAARSAAVASLLAVGALGAAVAGQDPALALNVGRHDFNRTVSVDSVEVGAEIRLTNIELARWSWGTMSPAFGAFVTDDSTHYVYGGFRLHMPAGPVRVAIHASGGAYGRGDGLDLGGVVEFRTGIEVAYRVAPAIFVGLDFHHLSNAGIYPLNPGVNSLVANVSFRPWQASARP
ncbi:MAG: acyloxyacyl hydrolase [Acidobacteriota bacterium]|nr:acyloxyacyl hydrolase [Acidobacteriota bacterium]